MPVPPIVVFGDLDDTLFEPHALSVDLQARRAFARIERERLPIVFCSSKTRAEIELIQQELGISQPFVCENGAAAFVPCGYFGFPIEQAREMAGYEVVEFGKTNAEIAASLHRTASRLDTAIVAFSDMSVEDVATDCDLSLLQARLAKLREYTEQFRVVDPQPAAGLRLVRALNAAGFECSNRGRYHLVGTVRHGFGGQFLRALYRRAFPEIVMVAFGDHQSAVPLLRQSDLPLIVRSVSPGQTARLLTSVASSRLSVAESLGGWAETILEIASAAQRSRSSCSS
jgi:mannosyl-3-phosphoglycerate phosphatase